MEKISELRIRCQNTRIYKWQDFLNRFYYWISIYFTWAFIFIKFNANHVTYLSGLICILGGYLILQDNKLLVVFGFLCFHLFAIFDMCDGEVARYNNEGNINGLFLDWLMHFIYSVGLMGGLVLYCLSEIESNILQVFVLCSLLVPLFDKIITSAGWTAVIWMWLRNFDDNQELEVRKKKKSNIDSYIIRRIKLIFNHIFMDHWSKLTLLLLSIIDLIIHQFGYNFIDYRIIITLYVGLFGPVYIFLRTAELLKSKGIADGYNRLFINKQKPNLPDDEWL